MYNDMQIKQKNYSSINLPSYYDDTKITTFQNSILSTKNDIEKKDTN